MLQPCPLICHLWDKHISTFLINPCHWPVQEGGRQICLVDHQPSPSLNTQSFTDDCRAVPVLAGSSRLQPSERQRSGGRFMTLFYRPGSLSSVLFIGLSPHSSSAVRRGRHEPSGTAIPRPRPHNTSRAAPPSRGRRPHVFTRAGSRDDASCSIISPAVSMSVEADRSAFLRLPRN